MKKLTKQGQVAGIQGFIMAIVGVAVILAVGLIVLSELQTSATTNSEAANATGTIITKLATVPTWIGILITVALAFIVLGYFYTRG
jgi:predicted RND superfamily exporter protein